MYIVHKMVRRLIDEFDSLGEFEHLVLLAVARLERDAYGVPIRAVLEDRTGRAVSLGAVYSTLRRLERKGYLDARHGDPTPVRGGRARKYFAITDAGLEALTKSRERLSRMSEGLVFARRREV